MRTIVNWTETKKILPIEYKEIYFLERITVNKRTKYVFCYGYRCSENIFIDLTVITPDGTGDIITLENVPYWNYVPDFIKVTK